MLTECSDHDGNTALTDHRNLLHYFLFKTSDLGNTPFRCDAQVPSDPQVPRNKTQGIKTYLVKTVDATHFRSRPRRPARCSTQRAGIAPPHAEGDELSGATSDRESNAFFSAPACSVGGVPVTRARNPWAMPEAST